MSLIFGFIGFPANYQDLSASMMSGLLRRPGPAAFLFRVLWSVLPGMTPVCLEEQQPNKSEPDNDSTTRGVVTEELPGLGLHHHPEFLGQEHACEREDNKCR